MYTSRLNQYRAMWIFIFFDLPTETKKQRKQAQQFRKNLLKDGFSMFQFSIYIRNCPSTENADTHINRLQNKLPQYGKIGFLKITDKQFEKMKIFYSTKTYEPPSISQQLEMF